MALTKVTTQTTPDGTREAIVVELTPAEEATVQAEWQANAQAQAAREANEQRKAQLRQDILQDTSVDVNSIPALRAEVDRLKAVVKDMLGLQEL